MKNVHVGGAPLDSFFKASWLHTWKILGDLELFNIQEKNSKQKEVDNDSKYQIVKNLVMELKNANPMIVML